MDHFRTPFQAYNAIFAIHSKTNAKDPAVAKPRQMCSYHITFNNNYFRIKGA